MKFKRLDAFWTRADFDSILNYKTYDYSIFIHFSYIEANEIKLNTCFYLNIINSNKNITKLLNFISHTSFGLFKYIS